GDRDSERAATRTATERDEGARRLTHARRFRAVGLLERVAHQAQPRNQAQLELGCPGIAAHASFSRWSAAAAAPPAAANEAAMRRAAAEYAGSPSTASSAPASSCARTRPNLTCTPAPAATTWPATIGWSSRIGATTSGSP